VARVTRRLSTILAERDAAGGAAWLIHVARQQRDELMVAVSRPSPVPLHVATLRAEYGARLAYALTHLLEWWRR